MVNSSKFHADLEFILTVYYLTLEGAFCWSSLCLFMYLPVTDMFTWYFPTFRVHEKPECIIKQTTSALWIEGGHELSRMHLLCPSYVGKRSIFQPYLVEPSEQDSLVGRNDIFSLDMWSFKEAAPELERSLFFIFSEGLIHVTHMLSQLTLQGSKVHRQ